MDECPRFEVCREHFPRLHGTISQQNQPYHVIYTRPKNKGDVIDRYLFAAYYADATTALSRACVTMNAFVRSLARREIISLSIRMSAANRFKIHTDTLCDQPSL